MTGAARGRRVVFRAAAGPRMGYGHLVRAAALAKALRVPLALSLRGGGQARAVAKRAGAVLLEGPASALLDARHARLLVIDDPSIRHAKAWRRAAARSAVPAASVHDLGIAWCDADLTIDGSIVRPGVRRRGPALIGPRYAILAGPPRRWREPRRVSVLIALGGGPRRRTARRLAAVIRRERPDVEVRIAAGLAPTAGEARARDGVVWLKPQNGLSAELARATVAVVGGGVSVYEACRAGTPAVAPAVVAAQRPTIRGLARRGAVVDGGPVAGVGQTATRVLRLLGDRARRARLAKSARSLVDGRGAGRVARALHALARRHEGGR